MKNDDHDARRRGRRELVGRGLRPETATAYVSSITNPYAVGLVKSPAAEVGYVGEVPPVDTLGGIPLWKPPYGRVTAIDLNTGDHRWIAPVGDLAKDLAESETPRCGTSASPPSGDRRGATCS